MTPDQLFNALLLSDFQGQECIQEETNSNMILIQNNIKTSQGELSS
jgi:hypothetical protein